jgi:hypothetical protein
VLVWKGAIAVTTDRAIADFGKAATVLHKLIHESVPLTPQKFGLNQTPFLVGFDLLNAILQVAGRRQVENIFFGSAFERCLKFTP